MNQKIQLIATSTAILLTMASVPVLSALASNSNDDDDDNGASCSPTTGNPYQEKCGKDRITGHITPRGDVFCGPEDTVTNTPQVCVLRP